MGIPSGFLSLFHDKREILDLESFNDELAFRISWDPLVGGGTKFCTYRLQKMPGLMNNSIEFRPTSVAYLFSILFAVFGLIFYLLAFSMGSMDIGVLISLSFLGFGVCSLWRLVKQKSVFNDSSRVFCKNEKSFGFSDICAFSYCENM